MDKYVTVAEVAERAEVSLPTAYKYLRDGTIPGGVVRYKRLRVLRQVFEDWLEKQDL